MPLSLSGLIVENGSVVAGSNTFASADYAKQYLFDRGLLTDDTVDTWPAETLLRRGLDVFINHPCLADYHLPLAEPVDIPQPLIDAQVWASYYIGLSASNDPANIPTRAVKREKVDVLEVEYMGTQGTTAVGIASMPNVFNQLALICDNLAGRRIERV